MKTFAWFLLVCALLGAPLAPSRAEDSPSPEPTSSKKQKVTKLDGTSLFGIVTLTDDYTLKISGDSGIMRVPLALLGEKDFKKYALQKDRSDDGRLWSERKDALEDQQKQNETDGEGKKKSASSADNSAIEIQLGEIAVFQPIISVYEATLADKMKAQNAESAGKEKEGADGTTSTDANPVRLFSGPGPGGVPNPLSGPGSSLAQPVISAGSSVLQSAGGVAPVGLPSAP